MGREKQFDNETNSKKQTTGVCEFHVDIKEVTKTGERKQVDKLQNQKSRGRRVPLRRGSHTGGQRKAS